MSLREAIRMVLQPLHVVRAREEERLEVTSNQIKEHLRKLELTAIRGVTESTDEAAEFHHDRRT
jgi:hypothetical protein